MYVPQMAPTVGADNLRSCHSKASILMALHSAWDCIEERRPATSAREFMFRSVERRITARAVVGTRGWCVCIVFPCTGAFSTLFSKNPELLGVQNSAPVRIRLLDRVRAHSGRRGDQRHSTAHQKRDKWWTTSQINSSLGEGRRRTDQSSKYGRRT